MNVVRLSSSGQISLPKEYRDRFDTSLYEYEIKGNYFLVTPMIKETGQYNTSKKYSKKDLKKAIFSSRNKREKNLSQKIDKLLYP